MERRSFIRVMGGGVVLAAAPALVACSSALPPEAVAAWQPPAPPAPGSDVRRWILAHAILAPHSHNLQSWLVDLRQPGEIALYCDRTRLLPETDPFSRQIMMSQGTFLEVLDLAARQQGLRADIQLFPQGEFDPKAAPANGLTALIRPVPDASVKPDPLFAQVFQRHTNRSAYDMKPPDAAALQAIATAAMVLGDALKLRVGLAGAQDARIAEHRAIARDAWRIELVTPRTVMESMKVLRVGPTEIAQHRDGISINEPMVRALATVGLFDRSKAPGPDDMATTQQVKDLSLIHI